MVIPRAVEGDENVETKSDSDAGDKADGDADGNTGRGTDGDAGGDTDGDADGNVDGDADGGADGDEDGDKGPGKDNDGGKEADAEVEMNEVLDALVHEYEPLPDWLNKAVQYLRRYDRHVVYVEAISWFVKFEIHMRQNPGKVNVHSYRLDIV